MKKEVETMKNKYIPKKLKMTIILNAMYQIYGTFIPYTFSETLERVGKVLMPNFDVTKFSQLRMGYQRTALHMLRRHRDYMIKQSYIVAYANTHNIKLYSREYFNF